MVRLFCMLIMFFTFATSVTASANSGIAIKIKDGNVSAAKHLCVSGLLRKTLDGYQLQDISPYDVHIYKHRGVLSFLFNFDVVKFSAVNKSNLQFYGESRIVFTQDGNTLSCRNKTGKAAIKLLDSNKNIITTLVAK